jgi:hypothetical protein
MPSVAQKNYLEKASQTYAGQLHGSNPGSDLSGETRFSLRGVVTYLREHAIEQDLAIKYSLGFVGEPLPGDERFQGMLSIPYLTKAGCMAIKFRNVAPAARPKYNQHSGQKPRLYNASAYFAADMTIGISEGEVDAIAATEHLGIPTLGCPGATNWNDLWSPLFRDFTRVFIFADGDDPGRDFALSVADKIGWRARIVQCPDGEDVASLAYTDRLGEISTSIRVEEEAA